MKVRGDFLGPPRSTDKTTLIIKVSKCAKIRNRYNQVPHLTLRPLLYLENISWCGTLTLYLLASSADNLCKQFGPRSGPTKCRPDLDHRCLTLLWFLKEIFDSKKISRRQKISMQTYPACKEFTYSAKYANIDLCIFFSPNCCWKYHCNTTESQQYRYNVACSYTSKWTTR